MALDFDPSNTMDNWELTVVVFCEEGQKNKMFTVNIV